MNTPAGRLVRALLLGALLVVGQGGAAVAQTSKETPSGLETLTAEPSLIIATVEPGETRTAELTLRAGAGLDIKIEPQGLGQSPAGDFEFVPKAEDRTPYSARPLIKVAPQRFRMKKGESRQIKVTIRVPRDAGEGARYALLQVSGTPVPGEGNVAVGVALGVSAIITLADTSQTRIGVIEDLAIASAPPGQPLPVTAVLKNTGNTHFGAQPIGMYAAATLRNANGAEIATNRTALTGNSIIPTFGRAVELSLAPGQPLAPGRYQVEMEVGFDDGTVLDRATTDLEIPGGAVLPATGGPSSEDLPLLLAGLLGALAAALVLITIFGTRRLHRRTAGASDK